eukprot:COSAG06_NODE_1200_length_10292_cov_59.321201_6_plen_61_part_00
MREVVDSARLTYGYKFLAWVAQSGRRVLRLKTLLYAVLAGKEAHINCKHNHFTETGSGQT